MKELKEFSSKNWSFAQDTYIGEELDKQFREYVAYIRSTGTAANTSVITSCAEGILMHKDACKLARVDFNKGLAHNIYSIE